MITASQKKWTQEKSWQDVGAGTTKDKPQLVLVFGGREVLEKPETFDQVKTLYPEANIIYCSTAGEIIGEEVLDNSLCVTALHFEKTKLAFQEVVISQSEQSYEAGRSLGQKLPADGLVHVNVFSDGSIVNGTSLVKGLTESLAATVSVTGGMVGDGANFKRTLVGFNSSAVVGKIVVVGYYGAEIKIGYGSLGGWDSFGPERVITKAVGNVLFELDHKPALALYKEYLGDQAKDLPGSGLLFPLRLTIVQGDKQFEVVRTILAVDETNQSLTFAGDMPEGAKAALMKANFERLIDGAGSAAGMSIESIGSGNAQFALLVSCVGRKLVLKDRVEEEVEAVHKIVGSQAVMTGFYSYGEICPVTPTEKQCQLHNQTMTVTTFREN